MEPFHIIVLVVASVSLILILTVAGILIRKDKHSQKFPLSHKEVPDGWNISSDGDVTKLIKMDGSTNPIGSVPDRTFTSLEWKDICIKKKWADQNNVYWDGITTYNGC